jgi:hypothetical protein
MLPAAGRFIKVVGSRISEQSNGQTAILSPMQKGRHQMNKRPVYVTVVSWYIIISSALGLLGGLYMANKPVVIAAMSMSRIPPTFQYVIMFVGIAILYWAT